VQLIIVNLPGYEEGLPDMALRTSLPILQDTNEDGIATCYGASKWYIYVIDPSGIIRRIHYSLDLSAERDRLLAEIAAFVEGAR